ncbi:MULTISPECIES: MarR family winged helix-turn-helix transcriptional regulator [unclassified Frondihabitans]|uniref:MarR family winged helix-turn-helix transcriptional regulator n=1 Tax=unclassified Frondihabitans TaxID=2626248 RepID=UPI000F50A7F8|nr:MULTISPECIES: MarR family winged helix-turn-helix transcriptional regulator [unclassified Frondihabitans]RPE77654.1 DNA-binding MarR family transcriptional regulator [Frondihabitans sp. PhB153]RPF07931.1 DNA-binding MarR family transcriptional regulator [Frondihabitans sp. PhB161]
MTAHPDDSYEAVAPLSQTLHRLDEAHRRFRSHVARSLAITPAELTALLVIAVTPKISPSSLAADLSTSDGNTTALIDGLEDAGLLRRVPSRTPPHLVTLELTDDGQRTLVRMRTAYRTVLGHADTDGSLTAILPQLDNITTTLNTAAKNGYPTL